MKLGTQLRLADGREGTVVYNSLIGVGIKWGLHDPDPEDFVGTDGNTTDLTSDDIDFEWEPDAMLREQRLTDSFGIECVGNDYEIIVPAQLSLTSNKPLLGRGDFVWST